MLVRRRDTEPADLTWLGSSTVADISPDGATLLFLDGGSGEKSYGTWWRPLSGGDAVRLGSGIPGAFAPDGKSVVGTTSPLSGAPQIVRIPVGPGAPSVLTSSTASHSFPSFSGPGTILFVRSEAGKSEIWKMAADGSSPISLGAAGCDLPAAHPSGRTFLARCGETKGGLFLFPMEKGAGRKLLELPGGDEIIALRFDRTGEKAFLATRALRLLTLDVETGVVRANQAIDLGGPAGPNSLRTAARNDDASLQVFSFDQITSGLYLADGL
jgi:Tol biopolymer transport system component